MDELLRLLDEMVPEWNRLVLFLGVPDAEMGKIDQSVKAADCLDRMILKWIKVKGDKATMAEIIKALDNPPIQNKALAKKLREDKRIRKTFG